MKDQNGRSPPQRRLPRQAIRRAVVLQAIDDAPQLMKPIFIFLAETRLRSWELANLRWEDIDNDVVHVRSSELQAVKPGCERDVILSEAAKQALALLPRTSEWILTLPGVETTGAVHTKRQRERLLKRLTMCLKFIDSGLNLDAYRSAV